MQHVVTRHPVTRRKQVSKAGNVFNNPITGESGYVRVGTEETDGRLLVTDLRVRPGGAVLGAHLHPTIDERFTVVRGKIGYIRGDQKGVIEAGQSVDLPKGIPHDWWNAGENEARVIVEIRPATRFEQMVVTLFGLAREGRTNKKGMPNLLQLAVISQEFADVVQFMNPPPSVQRLLFAVLAPLGRLMGYKAIYPHYYETPVESVEVEPLPVGIVIAGLHG
jgi:mannose-6-phosphate isomerase-like protein (cupin superfamily)